MANQSNNQQLSNQVQQYVQKEARRIAESVYSEQATKFGVAQVPFHKHNGFDASRVNAWDLVQAPAATGNVTMAHTGQYQIGLNNSKTNSSFKPAQVRFNGIALFTTSTFTVATASAVSGAVYSTSGSTTTGGSTMVYFTVTSTLSGGTTLVTAGAGGLINSSGILTIVSGTGDTHINYSSVSATNEIRALVVGDAFVNSGAGSSFYFQPQSSSSVVIGGPNQVVIQSSSCLIINDSGSGGVTLAEAGEGHIVDVSFPNLATQVARATIPDLGDFGLNQQPIQQGNLIVDVTLAAGWWIQGNWQVM